MSNFNESEIFKSASPEQKILWNDVNFRFPQNAAITQTYQKGQNSAWHQINFYIARTIWVIYQIRFSIFTNGVQSLPVWIGIYDENNTLCEKITSSNLVWNTTGSTINYYFNTITINNFWCGRIVVTDGTLYSSYIGYKLQF